MQHPPTNERLSTMDRWKGTSLCLGLLASVLPLIVLPTAIAGRLRSFHPIADPIDTALVGIALSLCVFLGLGRVLGLPLSDVFVRRPTRSVLPWTAFGAGLAVSVIAASLVLVDGTLGVDVDGRTGVLHAFTIAVVLALWAAVLEELLLRGYLLSIVGHQWGWPAAIVVTSGAFGLLHNGHASETTGTILYVGTAALAGVLFALVTYYTGSVWNAVAIHATWNTAFSPTVLAFRGDGGSSDALVTYALETHPALFGGGFSSVTESPFTMLVLAAGAAAVFGRYGRWSA